MPLTFLKWKMFEWCLVGRSFYSYFLTNPENEEFLKLIFCLSKFFMGFSFLRSFRYFYNFFTKIFFMLHIPRVSTFLCQLLGHFVRIYFVLWKLIKLFRTENSTKFPFLQYNNRYWNIFWSSNENSVVCVA